MSQEGCGIPKLFEKIVVLIRELDVVIINIWNWNSILSRLVLFVFSWWCSLLLLRCSRDLAPFNWTLAKLRTISDVMWLLDLLKRVMQYVWAFLIARMRENYVKRDLLRVCRASIVMDPDTPPPTEHILRPHHIALLTIFVLTFKTFHATTLPSPFTLHLYRLLLNETSEVGILC